MTKDYIVISENGKTVCESDDIFDTLKVLKREPPGSKLIRAADRKTLAYTTAPKLEFESERARRKRRSPA